MHCILFFDALLCSKEKAGTFLMQHITHKGHVTCMHSTYKVTPQKTIEANKCCIQETDTVLCISNTSDIWPSTSSCTAACPFLAIYLTTGFWGSIALGCIRFHYAHHTNQTQCITMFFDISESHYSSAVWWLYCISLSSLDYEIYIDI